MRIKKFLCSRFAGLRETEVEFAEGLNIVLGPNEAGKSTLVDALYHTLFQDSVVSKRSNEGKQFYANYTPYPDGDFFDGSIKVTLKGQEFDISKEWGSSPQATVTLPNGDIVRQEERIRHLVRQKLGYGEATLSNLMFARQADIKQAVERIVGSTELKTEMGSLLRKAVMELGGVSIEKLRQRIDDELDNLLRKWDWKSRAPEGGRGIDRPWRRSIGKILESYYQKENLRRQMRECSLIEEKLSKISKQMKDQEKQQADLRAEINELSELESDINRQLVLQAQLASLKKEQDELSRINTSWPQARLLLSQKEAKLVQLRQQSTRLQGELEVALTAERNKILAHQLKRVDEKLSHLQSEKDKLKSVPQVGDKQFDLLRQYKEQIREAEVSLSAGKIKAIIHELHKSALVTKGFDEQQQFQDTTQFEADGFFAIEIPNVLRLEVTSGELDFEELRNNHLKTKQALTALLKNLGVDTILEASQALKERKQLLTSIQHVEEQINDILGERSLGELRDAVQQVSAAKNALPSEELREQIQQTELKTVKVNVETENLQKQIANWQAEYGDHNGLLEKLIAVKKEHDAKVAERNNLKALPASFSTAQQFKDHLNSLRHRIDSITSQYGNSKEAYFSTYNELPLESYEELKQQHLDAKEQFLQFCSRAEAVLKIKEVFEKQLASVEQNPFERLAESFSSYLTIFTSGKYQLGTVDESFEVVIKKDGGQALPVDMLSAGTYDGVALSLRLAMLEQLFSDRSGLLVLDDCLVDLDPDRRAQAVKAIQNFANDHQVIFTTCNPDTATQLGGNVIHME